MRWLANHGRWSELQITEADDALRGSTLTDEQVRRLRSWLESDEVKRCHAGEPERHTVEFDFTRWVARPDWPDQLDGSQASVAFQGRT